MSAGPTSRHDRDHQRCARSLGYKTHTTMISVPVTYKSLATGKDMDVFLGNWMPTMENDIKQYRDAGTVETVRANLRTPSTPWRSPGAV
jgi:glycine betaine/proline transport system substrate-binding protein